MGTGFDETSMTGVMRHQIAGDLIMDGDPGYDQARRVWNGMTDRIWRPWPPAAATSTPWPPRTSARQLRLAALKRRYDPDNVFRLNHNIAP